MQWLCILTLDIADTPRRAYTTLDTRPSPFCDNIWITTACNDPSVIQAKDANKDMKLTSKKPAISSCFRELYYFLQEKIDMEFSEVECCQLELSFTVFPQQKRKPETKGKQIANTHCLFFRIHLLFFFFKKLLRNACDMRSTIFT